MSFHLTEDENRVVGSHCAKTMNQGNSLQIPRTFPSASVIPQLWALAGWQHLTPVPTGPAPAVAAALEDLPSQRSDKLPELNPFCITCPQWFRFSGLDPDCYVATSRTDLHLVFLSIRVHKAQAISPVGKEIHFCHFWSKKARPGHGYFEQMVCPRNVLMQLRIGQPRSWESWGRVGSMKVSRVDNWGRTAKRFEQLPKHRKSKIWYQNSRNQWLVATVLTNWV